MMMGNSNIPSIRFAGFTDPWEQRKLGEVVDQFKELVPTPQNGYVRMGVRSHAKGTFLTVVGPGAQIEEKELCKVAPNNLVVNIVFAWEHAVAITTENDAIALVSHRFPQFSFHEDMSPNFFRFIILDGRFRHHLWLASPSGAGRNKTLNVNSMLEYGFVVPHKEEQQAIGSFFSRLDDLITLHQRKYDKLVVFKKAMLEQMFPQEGESVPRIRFAGFADPWEQRKFSDEFVFLRNNTLSRADLSSDEGSALDVHYGDVLIKFGAILDPGKVDLQRIADDAVADALTCDGLEDGDIIIADTAEDLTAGKCSELRNSGRKRIFAGLHTMPCRPLRRYAPGFLGHYLNAPAFHDRLVPLMQGIKVISISRSAMEGTRLTVPSIEEQTRIGTLLTRLDDLITLHQRKLELLRNIKKSLLDKMFV